MTKELCFIRLKQRVTRQPSDLLASEASCGWFRSRSVPGGKAAGPGPGFSAAAPAARVGTGLVTGPYEAGLVALLPQIRKQLSVLNQLQAVTWHTLDVHPKRFHCGLLPSSEFMPLGCHSFIQPAPALSDFICKSFVP